MNSAIEQIVFSYEASRANMERAEGMLRSSSMMPGQSSGNVIKKAFIMLELNFVPNPTKRQGENLLI